MRIPLKPQPWSIVRETHYAGTHCSNPKSFLISHTCIDRAQFWGVLLDIPLGRCLEKHQEALIYAVTILKKHLTAFVFGSGLKFLNKIGIWDIWCPQQQIHDKVICSIPNNYIIMQTMTMISRRSSRFWLLNHDLTDYKSHSTIMFLLLMCDVLKEKYFKFLASF